MQIFSLSKEIQSTDSIFFIFSPILIKCILVYFYVHFFNQSFHLHFISLFHQFLFTIAKFVIVVVIHEFEKRHCIFFFYVHHPLAQFLGWQSKHSIFITLFRMISKSKSGGFSQLSFIFFHLWIKFHAIRNTNFLLLFQ